MNPRRKGKVPGLPDEWLSHMTLPEDIQEACLLTPYAVESRYPGYWFEITGDDLKEAIRMTELTVAWANEVLKGAHGADS